MENAKKYQSALVTSIFITFAKDSDSIQLIQMTRLGMVILKKNTVTLKTNVLFYFLSVFLSSKILFSLYEVSLLFDGNTYLFDKQITFDYKHVIFKLLTLHTLKHTFDNFLVLCQRKFYVHWLTNFSFENFPC